MKWKYAFFAFIIVLFFFGIIELILWASGVSTLLSERDPFQGFSEQVRVFQIDKGHGIYKTPHRAVLHSFNYQEFKLDKPENCFRIFVIGGSSAYGFPWGAQVSFTRFLGDALQASWPGKVIEVINASGMSYGSHRLRIMVHEVLNYEPDALIIYGGHNEFVERRFYRDLLKRPPELDRLRLLLYRWRLYSFMTRIYEKIARKLQSSGQLEDANEKTIGELLGIDVSREHSVDVNEAEKAEVQSLFEENFRAILDLTTQAGVPVVLCTVPSNLSGWKPNQSLFAPEVSFEDRRIVKDLIVSARAALEDGDAALAAESLEKARSLAHDYAEVHFLLGKCYEAQDRWYKAHEAYVHARDKDAKPTRAESAINNIIHNLAKERGVLLVDIERRFEELTPNGLISFHLIQDYVHPNLKGHKFIALVLWKAFLEKGLIGEVRRANEDLFCGTVGTESNSEIMAQAEAPSTETEAKTPALIYNLAVVLENQGLIDEAMKKYLECRNLDPNHFVEATCNLGRLLHQKERFTEAVSEYRKALEVDSNHMKSLMGLAEALRRLGRIDQAGEVFIRATQSDPGYAPAWNRLGITLSEQNRLSEAEAAFRRAVKLDPKNAGFVTDLGLVLLFQNKIPESEAAFRKSIELRPDQRRSWNGLAAVLTEKGALHEAERIFFESLRIDPEDNSARAGLMVIEKLRKQNR